MPVADGAVLGVHAGQTGAAVHVTGATIAQTLTFPSVPSFAPTVEGLAIAYAEDGSVYASSIPVTFDAAAAPTELAARYQIDSGCSAGRGNGGALVLILAAMLARRGTLRAWRATPDPTTRSRRTRSTRS